MLWYVLVTKRANSMSDMRFCGSLLDCDFAKRIGGLRVMSILNMGLVIFNQKQVTQVMFGLFRVGSLTPLKT